MPDIIVDGSNDPITLDDGYILLAPGLQGTAGTPSPDKILNAGLVFSLALSPELDQALAAADMQEVKSYELNLEKRSPAAFSASPDFIEFRVLVQSPGMAQVVLSVDEGGAKQWHIPEPDVLNAQVASHSVGLYNVFRIPYVIPIAPETDPGIAPYGFFKTVTKKILKVLVYPIADVLLGPSIKAAISQWELHNRPHRVRNFLPDNNNDLSVADWHRLASGRALLYVHGTFSTAQAGFGELTARSELAARYGGRVFAFDHPTLSVSPLENAEWFFKQRPPGLELNLDIICHSRGGLVSRCLGGQSATWQVPADQFRVQRLVMAGVPNMGTQLVNADHMVHYLDRLTTCLDKFPDSGVGVVLEGVLTLVKILGHAALEVLDGLQAMAPGAPFLHSLDKTPIPDSTTYGIGSDFEPKDFGLQAAFCRIADAMADRIFGDAANDLVVPDDGMYSWGGKRQILEENYLYFTREQGVAHTRYFNQPETANTLLEWLKG